MERPLHQDDRLILDYLDGNLSDVQLKDFKERIGNSTELQQRVDELRTIHTEMVKTQHLDHPSAAFTQKVMANLDAAWQVNTISPKNGILLLIGLLVATGLAVFMLGSGAYDGWIGNLDLPKMDVPTLQEYTLPDITFNGKTLMKVIIIVNTALGFWLLDRTVLRPLFQNRARHSW